MFIDDFWIEFNTYDIIQDYNHYSSTLRFFNEHKDIVSEKTLEGLVFNISELIVQIDESYEIYYVRDSNRDVYIVYATCVQDAKDVVNNNYTSAFRYDIERVELIGYALDDVKHSHIIHYDIKR
jgi:hypothetical protein